jgi:hypothetical protein
MGDAARNEAQILRWTAVAHYVTSAVAVLFSLMWLWSLVDDDRPGSYDGVNAALFLLLLVGGAAMGLLYLARRRSS